MRQRSVRRSERCFVLEGGKVLEAALDANAAIEAVYHAPEAASSRASMALVERAQEAGARVFALREGVMEGVADAATPQPLCAIVPMRDVALDHILAASVVLVCVAVRDPGNVGSILRSADAAGAGAVVVCGGSAELYNPKVVRASAGALFRIPVVVAEDPREVLGPLHGAGFLRVGTVARGGEDYSLAGLDGKVAFVLGNEATGLDEGLADSLDLAVTIPMAGSAESLNVAMAATVLCFDLARRRRPVTGVPGADHLR